MTGLVIATMFGWLLWSISKELPKMDRPDVGLLPADVSVIIYNLGLNIVFFVIGFVALSSLWAVAGSLASRQQDLQSTTMPGHVLLFAPYLLAVTAGAGVKTVCSMLPVVSAMMMPARMAESSVPAWQVAVAIVSNLVATVLLVRLGTRIYERTLLRTDRKIGYSDALRPSVSD